MNIYIYIYIFFCVAGILGLKHMEGSLCPGELHPKTHVNLVGSNACIS